MLKIKNCNISFLNKVHPSDHSSIIISRIKKILSENFKKLDSLEGKVHLKNVRIDLGAISSTNFQFDFYKQFEKGCQQLTEKLSIEHSKRKIKPAKNEEKKITKRKLQNNKEEIVQLKKFVAELQFLPGAYELDALEKAYFSTFNKPLSEASKTLLLNLINLQYEEKPLANNHPKYSFEALQYILTLLDNNNLNKEWIESTLKQDRLQNGEELPDHLQDLLRDALKDNQAKNKDSEVDQKQKLRIVNEADNIEPSLFAFISNWLLKNSISDNWIDKLSHDYERKKGDVIPKWIHKILEDTVETLTNEPDKRWQDQVKESIVEKLINHTNDDIVNANDDREILASAEAFIFDWLTKNTLTGNWMSDLNQDLGQQLGVRLPLRFQTPFQQELVTSISDQEIQQREKLIKTITNKLSPPSAKDEIIKQPIDEHIIEKSKEDFIVNWLSENPIHDNWLYELSLDFNRAKGHEIEDWLLKLLKQVDESRTINPEVPLRDRFIAQISSNQIIESNDSLKKADNENEWSKLDNKVQKYTLSWIGKHKLRANWLHEFSVDFEAHLGDKIPDYLYTFLEATNSKFQENELALYKQLVLSFSNQMKKKSLLDQKEYSTSTEKIDFKEVLTNALNKEFLSHNPALNKYITSKENRRYLLEWIEQKNLNKNWLQRFVSDYEQKYRQSLPESTITFLQKIEANFNFENIEVQQASNQIMIDTLTHQFIKEWMVEHDLKENWIERLISDYQSDYGIVFPIWLRDFIKDTFYELSNSLNSTDMNEQFVKAFSMALKDKKNNQPTKSIIDQAPTLAFIIKWLEKHSLSSNWHHRMAIDFKNKFGEKLPKKWRNLTKSAYKSMGKKQKKSIRKKQLLVALPALYNNQYSKKKNQHSPESLEYSQINDADYSFIINWFSSNSLNKNTIDQFGSIYLEKFDTEIPKWLLALLEKTLLDVGQSRNISMNKELFQETLLAQLIREESGNVSTVPSLAKYQYKRETSSSIISKIESCKNSNTSEKLLKWVKLISNTEGSLTYTDWLEILKKRYQEDHGTKMSMSDQLIFLESCIDTKSQQEITQQDYWTSSLKAELKTYLQTIEQSGISLKIMKSPKKFYRLIKKIPFDINWFDKVKQAYKKQYHSAMPKKLQKIFFNIRIKKFEMVSDDGRFDQSFTAIKINKSELNSFLGELLNKQELTYVPRAIASISKIKSTQWVDELLQSYQSVSGQELALETQIALIRFGSSKQRWTPSMTQEKIKGIISNQLNLNMDDDPDKSMAPSRLDVFRFFKKQIAEIETTSDWLPEFKLRYKHMYKEPLPINYEEWINEQVNKITISEDSSPSSRNQMVASAFLNYIDKKALQDKAKDLVALFNTLPTDSEEPWFALIMRSYKKAYSASMPLALQSILLEFTKKINSFKRDNIKKLDISERKNLLTKALDHEIEQEEIKEIKWSKEQLSKLYDWMDSKSWTMSNSEVIKNDYKQHFGVLMPKWMKQILMANFETNKPNVSNLHKAASPRPYEISQRIKSRPKRISDGAKLLRLKKQLENMTNEKNIPKVDIIQDAGIISGWVFWKKCFDRFGWLKDGKFYKKNGIYTGTLVANWLTHLGTSYVDTLNPFMITICDLLVEESIYMSKIELESHMEGEKLDASIDNYYSELMSMWTVFEVDQKTEFKELFIQREGVVTSTVYGWKLSIVKEPYDALMIKNPIPWPLTVIRFPWTSTTIDVEW